MRVVEIGSSAEAGSSIRITSGSTASALAMQSRCCWPPESPKADVVRRSFTSSQSVAKRLFNPVVQIGPAGANSVDADAIRHIFKYGFRERIRFLKDHSDLSPQ